MAYASWVSPNKTSGSGNDTVSWTGQEHTGRNARQTTATFSASGVADKVLTINQTGKTEFVSIDSAASVGKTGGTVTINGTTNSSKLTFSLANNNIQLVLPSTYNAGGASATNGTAIAGDPGAAQQFSFSITFTNISANTGVSERTSQLTVTANGGQTATCTVTQAAGDAMLSINSTEITLTAAGTPAVSVDVTSNTSWSVS